MIRYLKFSHILLVVFYPSTVKGYACPDQELIHSWPANINEKFDFPTVSPLNINVSNLHYTSVPTNIDYKISIPLKCIMTNTGTQIIVKTAGEYIRDATIQGQAIGGPYFFEGSRFFWNKNYGCASNTLNGKCTSLEVVLIYRNGNYSNFNAALTKRNGFVIYRVGVQVGNCDYVNTKFQKFADLLSKVQFSAGASVEGPGGDIFGWIIRYTFNKPYITYPGSLTINLVNEKTINKYVATIIEILPNYQPCISLSQFQLIYNNEKETYSNIEDAYNPGCSPIVLGRNLNITLYY